MTPDEALLTVKRLRRGPIWSAREPDVEGDAALTSIPLEKLLPHRSPFLLIDRIKRIDLIGERLWAQRRIGVDDPVFAGHFPAAPVYPGVLQVEAIGQAAVCLTTLLANPPGEEVRSPVDVRASRIHDTLFLKGLGPGDDLDIQVSMIERDNLICCFAGQVWVGDQLCCLSMGELHVLGD
jgi:3-hydroxyacyl-[acyl-carrier-protein] dehydratase